MEDVSVRKRRFTTTHQWLPIQCPSTSPKLSIKWRELDLKSLWCGRTLQSICLPKHSNKQSTTQNLLRQLPKRPSFFVTRRRHQLIILCGGRSLWSVTRELQHSDVPAPNSPGSSSYAWTLLFSSTCGLSLCDGELRNSYARSVVLIREDKELLTTMSRGD